MSGELLWYVSRATGVVALALLTLVLVLGVTLSSQRRPHSSATATIMLLHRSLSLGMTAFLGAHIVTAVVDSYVDIGWLAAVVPFASPYERLWTGLGAIAVDLLAAVVVTSLLRHRLPEYVWRAVHWCAYAMWPIAVVHGFAMGGADAPWLRTVTIACGLVGVFAIAVRLWSSTEDAQVRRAVDAKGWS